MSGNRRVIHRPPVRMRNSPAARLTRGAVLALTLPLSFAACASVAAPAPGFQSVAPLPDPATVEALQRLEAGKWHPSTLGGVDSLAALYAENFVTVEYGAEPFGK